MSEKIHKYKSADNLFKYHYAYENVDDTAIIHTMHSHNQYEFLYLFEGDIEYAIEGASYKLTSGDIVFVNYHEFHSIKVFNKAMYHRVVFQMSEKFISDSFGLTVDLFEQFKNKPIGRDNYIPRETAEKHGLDKLFLKLTSVKEENAENDLRIKCILVEMLLNMRMLKHGNETFKIKNNLIEGIVGYLNDHIEHDFTLEEAADKFFISKFHLCRIFKREIGISIGEYITKKRVMFANYYIQRGMSATEASQKTGFNNYSNFYRSFVKILGQSPTNITKK